ncbi:hypothetical protein [Imbroritus primus]
MSRSLPARRRIMHALVAGLALSCVAVTGTAFASGGHGHAHAHKPEHGGVVAEASDVDFELVARADSLTLHVRDHGKPLATTGASAKVTLLNGSTKREATLAPAGDNRLEARGEFQVGPGTKAAALVSLPGRKAISVRFALR